MNYDVSLFLEIIESEGIIFLRADCLNDVCARFYQGRRGNLVIIDTTDEDMDEITAKDYLRLLGLAELIPALFPSKIVDGKEKKSASVEVKNSDQSGF